MAAYGSNKTDRCVGKQYRRAFTLNFNPFNLAFGKDAVASSATSSRPALSVVDGGAGSRWEKWCERSSMDLCRPR